MAIIEPSSKAKKQIPFICEWKLAYLHLNWEAKYPFYNNKAKSFAPKYCKQCTGFLMDFIREAR